MTKKKNKDSTEPRVYPISNKKPDSSKEKISHAVGVINSEEDANEQQGDYHEGVYKKYPTETVNTWIPQYNVVPYSHGQTPRPLSGAQIQTIRNRSKSNTFFPKFFMNPYQDLDYMVLQDIYANTIAGRIIDKTVDVMHGTGMKPILKLRNPNQVGDEEAQQKKLEDGQQIIDDLIAVDENIGDPDDTNDDFLDVDFNTKMKALTRNSAVFGRDMAIKEFLKPVVIRGKSFANIPNVLKIIHPRDMGIVEIDQPSWKLKSIQIRFTAQNITPRQMMYLEHSSNNPIFNGLHYGYSMMQSMIGASRTLRQMIEKDYPTITKHVWAGYGFLTVKPQGTTESAKEKERDDILANLRTGRWNLLLENPEDVKIDAKDISPKIAELVQLADFLIRYNIAQVGIPQGLFTQEKDSNRATLIGKMRFFMTGVIKNYQDWVTQQNSKQWYMPNFKAMYGDKKEFKEYRIDAEFQPMKFENWQDLVEGVTKLNKITPLTTKAIGELVDIDDFESKVDPDIPRTQQKSFDVDDGEGNTSTVTEN